MKNLSLKILLVSLFSLVIVTSVECNILSRNSKAIYQEKKGVGKEMVYLALNAGRIVGNMVFTMDDDLINNVPNPNGADEEGKPSLFTSFSTLVIIFGFVVLFALMMFLLFKGKVPALNRNRRR